MIINAYQIALQEQDKKIKNDNVVRYNTAELIKEISAKIIKEEKKLIETYNMDKVKSKIREYLFNYYSLNDEEQIENIIEAVTNRIYGYGIIQKYIDDPNVSDIRIVAFDAIFVKEKGKWRKINEAFADKRELEEYVRFCALKNGATINYEKPIVVFSDRKNSLRIEAGIEPANVNSPSLVVRIHRKGKKLSLESLFVQEGMLNKETFKILSNDIKPMSNVILCGKGGSGKTTLLKVLIDRIPKEVSITSNEETAELYLENRNIIQRECILGRSENKNIDLDTLSRHALVMSNDVIIIGELKGAEANSFFDSISTGHTGLATVHSDSAQNAIDRIITLIKKDIKAQYYTESFLRRLLASSIDYIIYLENFKVKEIAKVKYNEKNLKLDMEYLYNK